MKTLKSFFIKLLYINIFFLFIWACQGSKEANKNTQSSNQSGEVLDKVATEEPMPINDGDIATKPVSPNQTLNAPTNDLYNMGNQSRMMKEKSTGEGKKMKESEKQVLRPKDEESNKFNTEEYSKIIENQFQNPKNAPLSTFSIDVDKASYANSRRMIESGQLPYKDAVRIEEFVNYFDYEYPNPTGEHPFSIITEVSSCPWNPENQLVHIGIQGKKLDYDKLSPSNLVFLIDASGSMSDNNKLPLLKSSLKLLLNELGERDRIAIVAYAGAAGLVLPSTPATDKSKIIKALDDLEAGGSTAGGEGILLAYKVAKDNFIKEGNNRIILATDGDFNVGVSSTSELVRLVEEKRKEGVYLTLCGFGMGNYKDDRMEEIAKNGNGNYFYIDNINEAKKVFVKEMRATLFTIAKDVKIQIEFNPNKVQAYRLIGYENRMLKDEDFNDDKKDAGELGAGHTVTALYEIIPVGIKSDYLKSVDALKYQNNQNTNVSNSDEMMTIKFRYKRPSEDTSRLISHVLKSKIEKLENTSDNFRFSASVAEFGLLLRESEFKGKANYNQVISIAKNSKGKDNEGYRAEFIRLVEACQMMKGEKTQE
jgi:Ca-activated chloride channel family protein